MGLIHPRLVDQVVQQQIQIDDEDEGECDRTPQLLIDELVELVDLHDELVGLEDQIMGEIDETHIEIMGVTE